MQGKVPFGVIANWVVYDAGPAMFPGLARARGGDLVVSFCTVADGLPGGEIHIIRSSDGGREWSLPQLVVRASKSTASVLNAIGLTTLRNGRMLLPYNEVELHGCYEDRDSVLFILDSKDAGHSWSPPRQVASGICEAFTYGQILEQSDGLLLLPVWGRYRPGERWRSRLLKSRDGGDTWGEHRTIAYDPEARLDSDYCSSAVTGFDIHGNFDPSALSHPEFRPHCSVDGFGQASCVFLANGPILAVMDQQGVGRTDRLDLYQAVSRDGGETWLPYQSTGICGMAPSLHWSPRGRLILAHRRCARKGDVHACPGVALTWSEDDGCTWKGELLLVDPKGYRYTAEYQAGYPAMVNLDDENILVIFYSYSPELPHGRYLAANLVREND